MMFITEDIVTVHAPKVHTDQRGSFQELFTECLYGSKFVQVNHSYSVEQYTLRGMHYQIQHHAQAKLVKPISGTILDVVVDIDPMSSTFGRSETFLLESDQGDQIFVPMGYAHGFITLEPKTHVIYMVDSYYSPKYSRGFLWDDPYFSIKWDLPMGARPIVSKQDSSWESIRSREDFIYADSFNNR
jgi:dTDP-4-dehydrorhamnose 3,5-epimerase